MGHEKLEKAQKRETNAPRTIRRCERAKSGNDVQDARERLAIVGKDYGAIHEWSQEDGVEVVEVAYSRGAVRVEAAGTISNEPSQLSVDMLLITLPKTKENYQNRFQRRLTPALSQRERGLC
ncbi:MAG TPA: hypothetical protein VHE81_21575 [Lacipirellulaceae bacterium]|nr:hypothetical protein [Lacipirellulaceae bacterium]